MYALYSLHWYRTSDSSLRGGSDIANSKTASTKTFVTALILNGAIAGGEILVFTLVRRYFRFIYEPRSLSISKACVPSLVVIVSCAYFCVESDSSHYLVACWDGSFLSSMRILTRSSISMDWTATSLSVSSA
jgi:hypothetical protein